MMRNGNVPDDWSWQAFDQWEQDSDKETSTEIIRRIKQMTRKEKHVDVLCVELAKRFLHASEVTPSVKDLAETIQNSIEDWFQDFAREEDWTQEGSDDAR